ncbi:hypothetical protein LCGC14_1559370 [marine sediment metagenome]|uniref:Nucleotide modification associated domain-containing protein n=1 Tax=marine sediment metagenome TaxID=412755 RepID=A0A0F9IN00_9ZZZZ
MCEVCENVGYSGWSTSVLDTTSDPHPSSQRFHYILKELGKLHDKKQKDYGTDADPFNNIRASAKEWGIPAWVGAMLRATDKVRRLQKFADAGELANESVIDAFDDLAVYAVIARVMYEEAEAQPICNDCGQELPKPGDTHLCG